jgi:hypothetical protein
LVILTGITVKATPLHIVDVIAVTAGLGFTVTITVKSVPMQLPDVGVTVYSAVCAEFAGFVSRPLMTAAFVPAAPPIIPPVTVGADQL